MKEHMSIYDRQQSIKKEGSLNLQDRYHFQSWTVRMVLFILTLCSIPINSILFSESKYSLMTSIWKSMPYVLGVLIILVTHSIGHYIQARLNKVKAFTPYFVPAPGVGTLGAYTAIQWPIADRNSLILIFATGPILGFLAAWIVLIIGLFFSEVVDIASLNSYLKTGDSIIMHATSHSIYGNLPATKDVMLHPIAYAGWLGLFYNFCHLLPIVRFDGGRLVYALWGYRVAQRVSIVTIGILLLLGIVLTDSTMWIVIAIWGSISAIGMRRQYPYDRYDQSLSKSSLVFLGLVVAIFIVSFTSVPLPILRR
jgi:membrane-associated protease RseP (regulator of RpoE activity)